MSPRRFLRTRLRAQRDPLLLRPACSDSSRVCQFARVCGFAIWAAISSIAGRSRLHTVTASLRAGIVIASGTHPCFVRPSPYGAAVLRAETGSVRRSIGRKSCSRLHKHQYCCAPHNIIHTHTCAWLDTVDSCSQFRAHAVVAVYLSMVPALQPTRIMAAQHGTTLQLEAAPQNGQNLASLAPPLSRLDSRRHWHVSTVVTELWLTCRAGHAPSRSACQQLVHTDPWCTHGLHRACAI